MDQLTKAWVRLSTLATPTEKKNDTGAGIVEYAAILILVAAVAAGIWALGIPDNITDSIGTAVSDILSGPQP
ncbi:hypothetical protein [Nocardiopsis algeriensis]|uniref:Flp pilus assembly pilin Flp n=1 Tax=Nocardiopsis algeriensis TaxID=1478215 RepID=A0A841IR10_9ACTN|nr:hypothetical protein [Nocardiopsis algeriensis]MBB6120650.1 Flp pilus assembly pilin Flp [Nocardiopsis algeriensis]